jgi:hypothetical protein
MNEVDAGHDRATLASVRCDAEGGGGGGGGGFAQSNGTSGEIDFECNVV